MQIHLQNVRPEPLLSQGIAPESQLFASDFQFQTGNRYLVVAASGKGKSTLLHILYGLRRDFDGEVHLDQRSVRSIEADAWADLRRNQLSIVFQDLRLFPDLTARENIELNNALTQHKTAAEIEVLAERFGVAPLLDRPAATLSYGQRQRVALIRALCQPFKFLLLDEPFSHLDEANQRIGCALIREACDAQGAGLILVSLGAPYFLTYDETVVL